MSVTTDYHIAIDIIERAPVKLYAVQGLQEVYDAMDPVLKREVEPIVDQAIRFTIRGAETPLTRLDELFSGYGVIYSIAASRYYLLRRLREE